jgi:hypothetical protein
MIKKISIQIEWHQDTWNVRYILSVIEKAEEVFDKEEAKKLEKKLKKEEFDLDWLFITIKTNEKKWNFWSNFEHDIQD